MFTPQGLNIMNIPMPPQEGTSATPWSVQVEDEVDLKSLRLWEEFAKDLLEDGHDIYCQPNNPSPRILNKADDAHSH